MRPFTPQYNDQARQDIAKALMKAAAEQFIKSEANGMTPFHVAKTRGNEELRKLLKVRAATRASRGAMRASCSRRECARTRTYT